MVTESFSHAPLNPQPGSNLGESDCQVRLEAQGHMLLSPFSPKGNNQKYVSPVTAFTKKAKKLCEPYRRAYGLNAKVNCCLDCKREKCLVPEGNF